MPKIDKPRLSARQKQIARLIKNSLQPDDTSITEIYDLLLAAKNNPQLFEIMRQIISTARKMAHLEAIISES